MSYMRGSENLGFSKNMLEWVRFHVKIKYLETECIEMRECIGEIAWNCEKCPALF